MNCSVFSIIKYDYVVTHYAKMHSHQFYEINCYLDGNGYTVIGDKRYDFSAFSLALIPPNTQHDEKFMSSGEVVCIVFEADELPFVCHEPLIVSNGESTIFTYVRLMLKEVIEGKEGYNYINNRLIKILLTEIQRIVMTGSDHSCKSLDYIKKYINENFYKKLDFTELAAMSGYSYDYFRHYFKKQYGLSPQNYLINVRLENAYSMLSSTPDISVTDVAANCGFSDSSQFAVMFSRHFGISPKKFQKSEERKAGGLMAEG
ncbi:MAG: AraC family transcriptional regulator [Eubacteriales bacterium]